MGASDEPGEGFGASERDKFCLVLTVQYEFVSIIM